MPPKPVVPEFTVAQEREAAQAVEDARGVQEAQESLRPLADPVRQHLPTLARFAHKAEGPVAAARQDLKDGVDLLSDRRRKECEDVIARAATPIDALKNGRRGLERFDSLTADECRREAWQRQIPQWRPEAWPGAVDHVRQLLLASGLSFTEQDSDESLRRLQDVHEEVRRTVRARLAQHGCTQPLVAKESPRSAPRRTELAFDPMETP